LWVQRVTFCRICEALCGLVVTVEDDRVVRVRADPDHPLSRGYACPKGIAMAEVQQHADRVLRPLRRGPRGFEPVGWDEALEDIGRRLREIRRRHGPAAIGWYMGNPAAFDYAHPVWIKGFMDAIGSPALYTAGSQDVNSRFVASALLYGAPLLVPIPDLARTRLLVVIGANPLVSHGSVLTAPRIRDQLCAITERGGRVVVVDPRRTETARAFEHVRIAPDSDAWFLLSLLHVVLGEGLEDRAWLDRSASGAGELRAVAARFPPEATATRTGIAPEAVRALARDLAAAAGAALYGRTGTCLGRFGTLVSFLLDAVNAVTGNLDRPGGAVLGHSSLPVDTVARLAGAASYGRRRSRFGGFPDVLGSVPASLVARDILEPGDGQVRALLVSAGNPVLSVPDGPALERALDQLDLCVSLDLFLNETNRHADYVLPATTFLERGDLPAAFLPYQATPFLQFSDPVLPAAGEARPEWWAIEEIGRRLGIVPSSVRPLRWLGRLGLRPSPERLLDLLLRIGPDGDWLGLRRRGWSLARLRRAPHGVVLRDQVPTGVLRRRVQHRDRRVHLWGREIAGEVARLEAVGAGDPDYPLRLIGMRELRSHNSWLHDVPSLVRGGRRQALRLHPDDAAAHGVHEGAAVRIVSRAGAIEAPAHLTDEIGRGVVALPHGWGHPAGRALAGANVNVLPGAGPDDLERLAGMAVLNGIPVRLERLST
jgi:anaerobic selenocysteine-containing dehydrogenase